ncbi:MAG: glycogen debranching protein GlgX [Acidobacteriota bacterium]
MNSLSSDLLPIGAPQIVVGRGTALPFGASLVQGGINFSVLSHHAEAVTLVLFGRGGGPPLHEVPLDPRVHRTGSVWHIFIAGFGNGTEYGFRLNGPRTVGHVFDPTLIMLDPYARAVVGGEEWARPVAAGRRALVTDADFDWGADQPLNIPLAATVIYELHVRGFTRDPSSGVLQPGTFAGLAEKIPYLKALGITAVQLMPIAEFDELDTPLYASRLGPGVFGNVWGYHPLAFFAPKASYAARNHAGGQIRELKRLVRDLHEAGIEIILDVVFNHTGEGEMVGPTSSFRGIDNATYYMMDPASGAYRNYTGCGNTVNCNHPVVRDLILDCLRFWVVEMHVDGFRFDLASVLGRGRDGSVLANPPLIEHIAADPVLAHSKLIAEAWDAAGLYQVGSFPAWGRWAELNGRFRDDVRRFVKGEAGLAGSMATRMAGSPDLYRTEGRSAHHSINFITSHDGFTLADLVAYDRKHNDNNGEQGRDGTDQNDSWNCGWEGPNAPAEVERLRRRQTRNLMTILFLSRGVPMILAGDEHGRTQHGNNNAYCHDSPVSWVNWDPDVQDRDFLRFVSRLIAFRRAHPQLLSGDFLDGAGGVPAVEWHGRQPGQPDWSHDSRLLVMQLRGGSFADDLYIAMNMHWEAAYLNLPDPPRGRLWRRAIDTSRDSPDDIVDTPNQTRLAGDAYLLAPRSVVVFEA